MYKDYSTHKYYNSQRKLEFLNSLVDEYEKVSINTLSLTLAKFGKFEYDYECDLCDFSLSYIKASFALIASHSSRSNKKMLGFIKKYVYWCELNGKCKYGNESKWNLVEYNDIDVNYVFQIATIKSPESFQKMLDTVYKTLNSSSEDSDMAYMYKVMLYLIYLGLTDEEVGQLKKSDINLSNKTATLGEKTILLDDYIIPYIKFIMDMKEVYMPVRGGAVAQKNLLDTPYLIRRTASGKPPVVDYVTQTWARWNCDSFNTKYRKETEEAISLSPLRIYDSGVYYKLYQREINGEKITANILKEYYNIENNFNITSRLYDYNQWRTVYYG
jgi:hypothetical protein